MDEILTLIERKRYFVLHAPRQVGKTSYLLALMAHLNESGRYHCFYFNIELKHVILGFGSAASPLAFHE